MSEVIAGAPSDTRAKSPAWPEAIVIGVAILTPLIAYLNSLGFAVLVGLAGLASLPLLFKSRRPLLGVAFLLALALWALVSMEWSLYAQQLDITQLSPEDLTGAKMLLEVGLYGAFIAAAASLSPRAADRASLTLGVGVVALSVLFIVEGVGKAGIYHWIRGVAGQPTGPDYAIRDVGRVAYVLVLLFWPAAVRLSRLKVRNLPVGLAAAVFVVASAMAGAALLGADAPAAAMAVSAVIFGVVQLWGRPAVWVYLCATVFYFAAAPLLVQAAVPFAAALLRGDEAHLSWAIRLDIWRFAADRILEHPFFGWGLDASRSFSPSIQLHPHNGALHLWLELGAVGVALAAVFWAWLLRGIARTADADRTMAAAAAATASVYLTIGALSFGIWQEWWLALGALASAACIIGYRGRVALAAKGGEPAVHQAGVGP
jgi:O-antigen ligase